MGRIVRRLLLVIASLGALVALSACLAGPQPEPPTGVPSGRADASAGLGDAGAYAAADASVSPPASDAGARTDDSAWDLDPSGAFAGEGSRTGGVIRWAPPGPGDHLDLPDAGDDQDADVDAGTE